MSILNKILETKRIEIAHAHSVRSFEDIYDDACSVERAVASFSKALADSPTGIISEFKRKSPSKGYIKRDAQVRQIVKGYSNNGASAISVLTDRDYFGGLLDDLREARKVTEKPLLRKDFIIDPYQICETRVAGADVILLIAAALTPEECNRLASFARSLGLEVLLEVHSESELGHINPHVNVVGINNRDLTTFVTDIEVSKRLGRLLPQNMPRISESGISSPNTVQELRHEGFQGFLLGEHFMKQADPAAALDSFIKYLEG